MSWFGVSASDVSRAGCATSTRLWFLGKSSKSKHVTRLPQPCVASCPDRRKKGDIVRTDHTPRADRPRGRPEADVPCPTCLPTEGRLFRLRAPTVTQARGRQLARSDRELLPVPQSAS